MPQTLWTPFSQRDQLMFSVSPKETVEDMTCAIVDVPEPSPHCVAECPHWRPPTQYPALAFPPSYTWNDAPEDLTQFESLLHSLQLPSGRSVAIPHDKLRVCYKELLEEGGQGSVFPAIYTDEDGKQYQVVVKELRLVHFNRPWSKAAQAFMDLRGLLRLQGLPLAIGVAGAQIVSGTSIKAPLLRIVMEQAKSDLWDFIDRRGYDNRTALRMSVDIARGLQHTHEVKLIHRDAKCLNLLVMHDGRVKWTDFGLSALATDKRALCGVWGTATHRAPEAHPDEPHNHMVDIWAVGLILTELLLRENIAIDRGQRTHNTGLQIQRLAQDDGLSEEDYSQRVSQLLALPYLPAQTEADMKALLLDTLNRNPFFRPKAQDITCRLQNIHDAYHAWADVPENRSEAAQLEAAARAYVPLSVQEGSCQCSKSDLSSVPSDPTVEYESAKEATSLPSSSPQEEASSPSPSLHNGTRHAKDAEEAVVVVDLASPRSPTGQTKSPRGTKEDLQIDFSGLGPQGPTATDVTCPLATFAGLQV